MMLPLELAAQSQPGVSIFAAGDQPGGAVLAADDQPGGAVLAADDQPGGAVLAAQAQPAGSGFDAGDLLANWVRRFIGFSAVALLLMLVIPAVPRAVVVATETPPWSRLGVGLAVALLLPLIGLLVFAIGLPLGLWWLGVILLALYPVALILSMSVSGLALGSWLQARVNQPGVPTLIMFAVGMLILTLASLLPYVGPVVNILAVIFGLGTLVLAPRSQRPAAPAPVEPPAPEEAAEPVSSAPVAA
ncbi:MAG: hypothetical protein JO057_01810 [Chloroflexi bacterium]|nr:hypothetical protein [Chloroflexota bacterium]